MTQRRARGGRPDAAPPPWRRDGRGDVARGFPDDRLRGSPVDVARALLGCRLSSSIGGQRCVGVIVETEAYGGPEDPASHAATARPTERNRVMYGPPGTAYVYRSYGVHWCLNVVGHERGEAGAVLIRGIDPLSGVETMEARRGGRHPLTAGPGRLSQAFGVTGDHNGHGLNRAPLRLERGWDVPDGLVGRSGRIGVSAAADWPHRFFVVAAAGVSR